MKYIFCFKLLGSPQTDTHALFKVYFLHLLGFTMQGDSFQDKCLWMSLKALVQEPKRVLRPSCDQHGLGNAGNENPSIDV